MQKALSGILKICEENKPASGMYIFAQNKRHEKLHDHSCRSYTFTEFLRS